MTHITAEFYFRVHIIWYMKACELNITHITFYTTFANVFFIPVGNIFNVLEILNYYFNIFPASLSSLAPKTPYQDKMQIVIKLYRVCDVFEVQAIWLCLLRIGLFAARYPRAGRITCCNARQQML